MQYHTSAEAQHVTANGSQTLAEEVTVALSRLSFPSSSFSRHLSLQTSATLWWYWSCSWSPQPWAPSSGTSGSTQAVPTLTSSLRWLSHMQWLRLDSGWKVSYGIYRILFAKNLSNASVSPQTFLVADVIYSFLVYQYDLRHGLPRVDKEGKPILLKLS